MSNQKIGLSKDALSINEHLQQEKNNLVGISNNGGIFAKICNELQIIHDNIIWTNTIEPKINEIISDLKKYALSLGNDIDHCSTFLEQKVSEQTDITTTVTNKLNNWAIRNKS